MKITYTGYTDCNIDTLIMDERAEFEAAFGKQYSLAGNGQDDYWADDTAKAWRVWLVARGFDYENAP